MIRYDIYLDPMADCYCQLKETKDGDYVSYDDYAKLEIKLKETQTYAMAEASKLRIQIDDLENAALKRRQING